MAFRQRPQTPLPTLALLTGLQRLTGKILQPTPLPGTRPDPTTMPRLGHQAFDLPRLQKRPAPTRQPSRRLRIRRQRLRAAIMPQRLQQRHRPHRQYPRRFRPVTRQQRFQTPLPQSQNLTLADHPVHPIRQFLVPVSGRPVPPLHAFAQRRQFRHHRRILAIMLTGHAIKHLRIIMRRFAAHPLQRDAGIRQRLPQGIAVGPRRLHGHQPLPAQAQTLQQPHKLEDVAGIVVLPGPLKRAVRPTAHRKEVTLAHINADTDRLAGFALRQPLYLYVLDTHRSVCFSSHGDDLLHRGFGKYHICPLSAY